MVSWGIPQEILYAISIKNMSQIRKKKYKNKIISSHRLVNICAGNSSGLIRDRNQIEIRDFLCLSLVFAQDCLLDDFVLSLTFSFIIYFVLYFYEFKTHICSCVTKHNAS